jgi:hypothetical protein
MGETALPVKAPGLSSARCTSGTYAFKLHSLIQGDPGLGREVSRGRSIPSLGKRAEHEDKGHR